MVHPHAPPPTDRVLWKAALRDDTELRVGLSVYRGSEYIDIRTFWTTPDGETVATKKGVHFNVELVPELIEALKQVAD